MSDDKIDRPLGRVIDLRPQLVGDSRARLLVEIARLHQVIGYMRDCCEQARKDCCHPGSLQARLLGAAIDRASEAL